MVGVGFCKNINDFNNTPKQQDATKNKKYERGSYYLCWYICDQRGICYSFTNYQCYKSYKYDD